MSVQMPTAKRDHLAYLSLLYAIWGDEVRSEELRQMVQRMKRQWPNLKHESKQAAIA